MLRQHFAAVLRSPIQCSDEAIKAVFPYAAGFLVGIAAMGTLAAVLIALTS